MKKRKNVKKKLCLLLSLCLVAATQTPLALTQTPLESVQAAEDDVTVGSDTVWSYLDDGSDPAGDSTADGYNRTSWTVAGYDDSTWKTGTPSFGAKKGKISALSDDCTPNTLLTQYKEDGSTDIEAYFFRTEVQIEDASEITSIEGSVIYDDAATVYVNGVEIAGFDDDSITANIQYGGSNDGDPRTGTISVTDSDVLTSALTDGTNVIAVELHQGRSSSSDIYFDMPSLIFSTEAVTYTQKNISLNVGSDNTEMNITWYANASGEGKLLVAKYAAVTDDTMPASAVSYSVTGTESNKSGYYSYQAEVTGLEADTKYAYQVVNGTTTSKIFTFTTSASGTSFSFAAVGDPQIGASGSTTSDTDGWEKTLNLISSSSEFSDVDFLLSAGDQVNTASNEDEYDGYLEQDVLTDLPTATVIGNHDSKSTAYDEHFNNPNESTYGSTTAGGDYYFVYNHVLFLALNSNNTSTAEHKSFMKEAIAATADEEITWKVVVFHHSIYSVASHSTESSILTRREELVPVFTELDIDVVLMGHDHVYCRTYMMDGLEAMTDTSIYDDEDYSSITNPTGILYVTLNSASGSKYYSIKTNVDFPYAQTMNQENVPNVSKVEVSDSKFTITTYRTSDMSVVDTFTINKAHVHSMTAVEKKDATCAADGNIAYWYCKDCDSYFSDEAGTTTITLADAVLSKTSTHTYGDWTTVTEATTTAVGVKKHTCTVCGAEETAEIPMLTKTEETTKTDDTSKTDDTTQTEDTTQTVTVKNMVATVTSGKKKNTLSWKKVSGADGYLIYAARCNGNGKTYSLKNVKTISSGETTSWTQKNLKANTWYKYRVVAYKLVNDKKVTIGKSLCLHSLTKGSKTYANPTKVTVTSAKATVKVNKKKTISASVILAKGKKTKWHGAKLRYYSSNEEIATVSSKGVIAGKKSGSCSIYVIAQNGVYKRIKVTVE